MTEQHVMLPADEHNAKLVDLVHPMDWENPTPDGRYNLVAVGAGTAGLVAASGSAGLGAKVALVERDMMGGDCLNTGCVPSKGVISTARTAATIRDAGHFGIRVPDGVKVNFAGTMERMRKLRAELASNDSARRFSAMGIDVYLGQARFTDKDTLEVAGSTLQFKKAVIATGARAVIPAIPGLDQIDYLTNETIFSLTELPKKFGVVGTGPIGCEMAQTFARLGSEVLLIQTKNGILPREDRDAARCIRVALERDGVVLKDGAHNLRVEPAKDGKIRMLVESQDDGLDEVVDQFLVAVGRTPNVEGLGLDAADVKYSGQGVVVNDNLRTTNRNIFAAGDVCSSCRFTHAADFQARIVINNALFMGRSRSSQLTIPWCTYTDPEIAHVGLHKDQAYEKGIETDTYTQELRDIDRCILDDETDGFVRVHVRKGTDRIVGATIVATNAGDMISEITMAMKHGIGLKKISMTIHPYPTQAEAIRKVGDQYSRSRLTPRVRLLMKSWFRWTR